MVIRRSIKAILVLVVIAIAAAIVSSFLDRSRGLPEPPQNKLLPEDVASRGTDFDHREFKLGKIVFRVRSQTDTVNDVGVRDLRDVELLVFDDEGEVQDAVTALEATYDVEAKQIELRKEVEIRLADGTTIYSDRLHGDLQTELIEIRQGFTFERTRAKGHGRDLDYRASDRYLTINRDFRMQIENPQNPLIVMAQSVDYPLEDGIMNLAQQALIQGTSESLRAERMRIELSPAGHVLRVDARQNARFQSPPHQFSGARILLGFSDSGGGLNRFIVEAGTGSDGERQRAQYRRQSRLEEVEVEGNRIEVVPRPGANSVGQLLLERFEARGQVRFLSPTYHIDESQSDRVSGRFRMDGHLENLVLAGSVSISRSPTPKNRQHLRTPRLTSTFEAGQLVRIDAEGPLQLALTGESEKRNLMAQESLKIDFQEAQPRSAVAHGAVVLESINSSAESRLRSPTVTAEFEAGLLSQVNASGPVSLESREDGAVRRSSSDRLQAFLSKGLLERIEQTGSFVLEEEAGSARIRLSAQKGNFQVTAGRLRAEGGSSPGILEQWEQEGQDPVMTRASQFQVGHADRAIVAQGSVQTQFPDANTAQPVRIEAETMRASNSAEWIVYSGGEPHLATAKATARGKEIRIQKATGLLEVEGQVDSLLKEVQDGEERDVRVQSQLLQMNREEGHALYTGEVRAQSAEMLMKSPQLELFLAPGPDGKVEKVRAWGGVEIVEPTRIAVGDTCFYFPDQNLVRLLGNPARVTDEKQGVASGPKLTFNPGTDSLVIESVAPEKP